MSEISEADLALVESARDGRERLLAEIRKVIIGQEELLEQVLVALFAGGHVLLIGVPGLAKTLLVSTLAKALSVQFKRVQFTPDMMPGDIQVANNFTILHARDAFFDHVEADKKRHMLRLWLGLPHGRSLPEAYRNTREFGPLFEIKGRAPKYD